MRLSRRQDENQAVQKAIATPPGEAAQCARCGSTNSLSDSFCSDCGAQLPGPAESDSNNTATVVNLPITPAVPDTVVPALPVQPDRAKSRRSRRWPFYGLAAALIAALAAAVVFGLLWHNAAAQSTQLQQQLNATQATLARTNSLLATTTAQLRSTTALAAKRRAVLLRGKDVLSKVDPVLSSVDSIQNQSGSIQLDGETLSSDADNLTSALATALNYLANTDYESFDVSYYSGLLGTANGYFYSMKNDEASFAGAESGYNGASATFGNRANAFSAAVRQLQRQLNNAVRK